MSWMNDQGQRPFEVQLAALKALDEQKRFPKSGPNSWAEVKPEDFGPIDYEIFNHGDTWVFFPVSNAALQWCYKVFGEWCDRWCARGFVVDRPLYHWSSKVILRQAAMDKLMSEDEYNEAMEEQHRLMHQGESQAGPEDGR